MTQGILGQNDRTCGQAPGCCDSRGSGFAPSDRAINTGRMGLPAITGVASWPSVREQTAHKLGFSEGSFSSIRIIPPQHRQIVGLIFWRAILRKSRRAGMGSCHTLSDFPGPPVPASGKGQSRPLYSNTCKRPPIFQKSYPQSRLFLVPGARMSASAAAPMDIPS